MFLIFYIKKAIPHDANISTQIMYEAQPSALDDRIEPEKELSLDNLHDITLDDSWINEALFTPWAMDSPMQHGLDGGSSSSRSSTATCKYMVLRIS